MGCAWRRRLCFLEIQELHMQKQLCISYLSEKQNQGPVTMCLASAGQNDAARIKKMPSVRVFPLTPAGNQKLRTDICQYSVEVLGHTGRETAVLPTMLHGFMLCSTRDDGLASRSIYAFERAEDLTD